MDPQTPCSRVRVLYDYEQQNPLELNIKRGDIITEVQQDSHVEGFWTGFLNGQFGIFPGSHVEEEGKKREEIMEQPENEVNGSTAHMRRNTSATDMSSGFSFLFQSKYLGRILQCF